MSKLSAPRPSSFDDAYLPLKDLARYAGLSVRTLRSHLADRAAPLPCYRVGGKVLVRRSEYDSWVRRFRVAGSDSLRAVIDDVLKGLV